MYTVQEELITAYSFILHAQETVDKITPSKEARIMASRQHMWRSNTLKRYLAQQPVIISHDKNNLKI
jgi:acyl carrier protein phosphodiesterase